MSAEKANAVKVITDIGLAHARTGHLHYNMVPDIAARNLWNGIGAFDHDSETKRICDGCEFGKSHRETFSGHSNRIKAGRPLDRIWCDLTGPISEREGKYDTTCDTKTNDE